MSDKETEETWSSSRDNKRPETVPEPTKIRWRDRIPRLVSRAAIQEMAVNIVKDFELVGQTKEIEFEERDKSRPGDRENFRRRLRALWEIRRKYQARAEWGNQPVRSIIRYRSGVVFPKGLSAKLRQMAPEDTETGQAPTEAENLQGTEELTFVEKFIKDNSLGGSGASKRARTKDLEGQIASVLRPVMMKDENDDEVLDFIALDTLSFLDTSYKVEYNTIGGFENENAGIKEIVFTWTNEEGREQEETVPGERAIFMTADGLTNGKEGVSPFQGILTEIDDADKTLADMREGNQYFAKPTPVFEAKDREEAERINKLMNDNDTTRAKLRLTHWKVIAGKFSLVSRDASGFLPLEKELTRKMQIIAMAVQVPIQHLGFPDVLGTQAGAENQMEPVSNFASEEQEMWIEYYQEVFDKAIALRNEVTKADADKLIAGLVEPVIPSTTTKEIEILKDIKLPAVGVKAYPRKALMAEIPSDFTVDELEEMMEEEAQQTAMVTQPGAPDGTMGGGPPPIDPDVDDRLRAGADPDIRVVPPAA